MDNHRLNEEDQKLAYYRFVYENLSLEDLVLEFNTNELTLKASLIEYVSTVASRKFVSFSYWPAIPVGLPWILVVWMANAGVHSVLTILLGMCTAFATLIFIINILVMRSEQKQVQHELYKSNTEYITDEKMFKALLIAFELNKINTPKEWAGFQNQYR